MKITRNQLRRIIKEEKTKLLSEANDDGTISEDEEFREEQLLEFAISEIDKTIAFVKEQSELIGGDFRGPAIRVRILEAMAKKMSFYKSGRR
tara:strand:- start:274 stop:549 length:276 start_codon:yes stop_codon:yes gene_type:complete